MRVEDRAAIGRFTTRAGGVSVGRYAGRNLGDHVGDAPEAVAENRRWLAVDLGLPAVAYMAQVHGAEVAALDAVPAEPVPGVDALVTAVPAVALAVLVADCVPVLLLDGRAGVVAVAHAGRRGLRAGVVPAALAAMARLGSHPGQVVAVLGPSICGGCYEVPRDVVAQVAAVAPGAAATTRRGTPGLDLRAGLAGVLAAAGVVTVVTSTRCSLEDDALYSHRGAGAQPTGRFAGVAVLRR